VNECRAAYAELAFQKVYQAVTQFCAVELSSIYVDVTKDRLDRDPATAPPSPRHAGRDGEGLPGISSASLPRSCVHRGGGVGSFPSRYIRPLCELFPRRDSDQEILARFEALLALRAEVSQALEKAQRDGIIAKPLEATVSVTTEDPLVLEAAAGTGLPRSRNSSS